MAKEISSYEGNYGIRLEACPLVSRDGYEAGQIAIKTDTTANAGGIAVSTCCENVDSALLLMDWFYSEEGAEISNYGWVENETYYVENGEKYINTIDLTFRQCAALILR